MLIFACPVKSFLYLTGVQVQGMRSASGGLTTGPPEADRG